MDCERTYSLLERIANLLTAEERRIASEHGLQVVHLHVLQYLNRSNRYSDSPVAVAEYFGLTKGTTSQSLIVLEKRGLIGRKQDNRDRRRVHCRPTRSGKRTIVSLLPPAVFKKAQIQFPAGTEAQLEGLLRVMQRAEGGKTFDVCHTCRFFRSVGGRNQCGLTGEHLAPKETLQICREHLIP